MATKVSCLLALMLGLGLLPALTGCNSQTTSDRDLLLLEYADLAQLRQDAYEADEPGRLLVIDVRAAEQYAAGHIPGAVNIRLADLDRRDGRLERAETIVVYGRDWEDLRSPAAAKKLIQLGYGQVYDFRGGLELWQARGGAVVQAE